MNINTLLDDIVKRLRSFDGLCDVKAVVAYPHSVRLSILKSCVIALGYGEIMLESCHIGDDKRAGEVSVFADIFVPLENGSKKASEIFVNICSALGDMNIVSIKAERISYDKITQAYVMKTVLSVRDRLTLGGDGGE